MFNEVKREINWNNKTLTIETGKIARQASGSVVVRMGNTVVLCAVTMASKALEGVSFFPLTVNFVEKSYAAGKIPGGFFKREAKPSDNATLVSRLIDRIIRPLFPENFYREVNVVCTVLSYDTTCNPDIVAIIAASAALAISEIPFSEAIAGARVGLIDDQMILNPSVEELRKSRLDLIVGGTKSSVLMVESEVKELSEEQMLAAVNFGHQQFQPVIDLINDLKSVAGKKKLEVVDEDNSELKKQISDLIGEQLIAAYKKQQKQDRALELEAIKNIVKEKFVNEEAGVTANKVSALFKYLEKEIVRNDILKNSIRIDGRKVDQIRPINIEVGLLPQVHGSALFTRGETQALVVTTLGSSKDEQLVEGLEFNLSKETFMLHYNFPPYSVGEVGPSRGPGRREIGHGKLAWRAINPVFPHNQENFSYVTRIVSEITESNGSSSMASVCGASLSLMDAGVPIKEAVSGIAMGLIKEGDNYVILSDIMGDEDHLGDMDFKVAGTKNGITALQMDIKINGISSDIMEKALDQAKNGRAHILKIMIESMPATRSEFNPNVPRVEVMNIPQKKIRDVIGARGKVVRNICDQSGAIVDIEDDGTVKISANNNDAIKKAIAMINEAIFEPEVGDIYEGPVVKVIDAGAFINISNNRDGFVHISELAEYRVDFVEDIINEADIVKVKVIGFDKKGRPKLSYRCVDQKTGEDISDRFPTLENRDERNYRDNDRQDNDRGARKERFDRNDRNDRDSDKKKKFF